MPNWCYNQEVIIGPEDEIRPLYNDLSKWTSEEYIENGFGTEWLGNIVARGINESREYENYACRGKIIDLFEPEKTDDGSEYKISFSSETAWAPMPGMWYALLKKRAPNCRYYYYAEEPGCEIYCSNDVEHENFTDETVITAYVENDDMKYLSDELRHSLQWDDSYRGYSCEDIKDILSNLFNDKNASMEELVNRFNEEYGSFGDGSFITIHIIAYEED